MNVIGSNTGKNHNIFISGSRLHFHKKPCHTLSQAHCLVSEMIKLYQYSPSEIASQCRLSLSTIYRLVKCKQANTRFSTFKKLLCFLYFIKRLSLV